MPLLAAVTRARRPLSPRSTQKILLPIHGEVAGEGRRRGYPVVFTYQSVTYWKRSDGSITLFTCTPCTLCETA
jgi:hypothetical protein